MQIFGLDPDNLPDDLPEGIKTAIVAAQNQHERAHMNMEAKAHMVERFVNDMDSENLTAFMHLLSMIYHSGDSEHDLMYWIGRVETTLQLKFNLCPACGKDHDLEASEQLAAAADEIKEEQAMSTNPDVPMSPIESAETADELTRFDRELHLQPQYEGYKWLPQVEALMIEYRIDDAYEEVSKIFVGFNCVDCGISYPTIADRMLKPANECHGCFQKAANG